MDTGICDVESRVQACGRLSSDIFDSTERERSDLL